MATYVSWLTGTASIGEMESRVEIRASMLRIVTRWMLSAYASFRFSQDGCFEADYCDGRWKEKSKRMSVPYITEEGIQVPSMITPHMTLWHPFDTRPVISWF